MVSLQRLSIHVGLLLLGLAVTSLLTAAGVAVPLSLGATGLRIPWQGTVAVLLAVLAAAGTDSLVRRTSEARGWPLYAIAPYWALPSAVTLTGALFLSSVVHTPLWLPGLLATGLLLTASMTGQLVTLRSQHPYYHPARLGLTLIVLLVGLVLFSRVAQLKPIGLHGALGVGLLGAGLSLELLRLPDEGSPAIYPYSLVSGMVLAEVAWALDFLRIPALPAGALLLLLLYVITGLGRHELEGTLGYRLVAEYVLVSTASLAMLFFLID